jgi:hypothetical protein
LGQSLTSPYTFTWTGVVAGTYNLTARATDNTGGIATSAVISIVVNTVTPVNQLPRVSITAPVNAATFTAPASITITATASDADGTITKVEFLNGSTVLGQSLTSPYTFTWTGVVAGTYNLTVRATDNVGGVSTSAPVTIVVNAVNTSTCPATAIPPAAQWVLRNDWSDQTSGSVVLNSTDALQIRQRQWGRNKLWAIQTGKSLSVVKGQSYTIKFDLNNDASNPISSLDLGMATAVQWDGPVLAQPIANSATGFATGTFTTKTLTLLSNYTGTVNLALALNWPAQTNNVVNIFLKNLSICTAAGIALRLEAMGEPAYEISPNPFESMASVKINAQENSAMEISISDLSGSQVYHSFSHVTNESFYLGENLAKGVYVVKAIYGDQVSFFSFIKL